MPNTHVAANGRAMPDPRLRHRMERAVETLLAALDAIDGDPDFEPDSDGEPWLGRATGGGLGCLDDREDDALDWVQR